MHIICSVLPHDGTKWLEPVDISGDPTRSEQNPSLFYGPDNAVWAMYTAQLDRQAGKDNMQYTAVVRCQKSTDGGKTWGLYETIFPEEGTFCRQPIQVLSNGRWIFANWLCTGSAEGLSGDPTAFRISDDEGKTWHMVMMPKSNGHVHANVVELEPGHLVQQRKNLLFVEKVPAHVEHHAAPSERRPIGDLRIRNLRSASGFRWQQLPQRGDAIDDAPVGTAPDPYAGVRHRQAVPFRRQGGRIEFQHDISPVAPIYGDSAIRRQHLVHVAGRGDENRIGDAQLQPFREPVGPVAPYRFLRSGNQHGPFIRRRPGAGHEPHSHSQRSINANKCHAPGHDQLPFAAVTRPFLRRASVSPY